MNARCGRCGTTFAVNALGRYPCPGCGVTNEVRSAAGATPGGFPPGGESGPPPGMPPVGTAPPNSPPPPPPPPPPPEVPSNRMSCPKCAFSFIVGAVAVVTCPMCSTELETGAVPGGATDPESSA